MPSRATNYLANALLNHITGNGIFAAPGAFYLALFTDSPGDNGSLVSEVVSPSYSRIVIDFDGASARKAINNAIADFPEALEPWGKITHWGVCDAALAGNILIYGNMQDADGNEIDRTIQTGDIIRHKAGNVVMEVL